MIPQFKSQVVQEWTADITDHERKMRQMARTEKAQTKVTQESAKKQSTAVEKSAKKQVKATKSVSNHFDILTMAIGGMSSEVGVAAETGKRLSEGFGALGVATMGVGLALGALAPHIGSVISGFTDLFKQTELPHWSKLQQHILMVSGAVTALREETELARKELQLLAPGDRATAERGRAANVLANRRQRATELRAEELKLSRELVKAEEDLAKAKAATAEASRFGQRPGATGWGAESAPLILARRAEAEAQSRAEMATKSHTQALQAADSATRNIISAKIDLKLAIDNEASVTERSEKRKRRAYKETVEAVQQMRISLGAAGPRGAPSGALQRVGAAGSPIGPGGPLGSLTDPLGRIIPPDGPGKTTDEELRQSIALAVEGSSAFGHFRDAALNAFAAVTSGSMSAGAALKQFFADSLTGMGLEAAGKSLSMLVSAAVAAANPTTAYLAPGYLSAAAFAAAKATAMLGIASMLGTSTGSPATGGFAAPGPVGGGNTTTTTVINLGDSYLGVSNRRRKAELERLLGQGRQGSYEG